MAPATKSQPWKQFWPPADGVAAQVEQTPEEMDLQRSYGTHASNTKGRLFTIDKKVQPWKANWPPKDALSAETQLTEEEMNLQRSYGTHASNTKGRIFTIEKKVQPWKANWPPKDGQSADTQLSEEEMNLQRSYGTHASNTKGRIFTVETKPAVGCHTVDSSKCTNIVGFYMPKHHYDSVITARSATGSELPGGEPKQRRGEITSILETVPFTSAQ
ncbi:hypothetical protein QBC33DRAFT_621439 [Phialemonium atrogriseum]|uniref:Uncharacterized protein n=1 Tax=Phialemonium atrogriseum TaxID=1093897 RepID=A0AAJ0FE45_9PEZI|nr:uncharacterized protein QBC33DRAFT_621439 [Phialemonium atrogriseum]KAK1765236.1 hypothetical protein QBC33DRAFT_621439 [Phialemonium atrogriseum]